MEDREEAPIERFYRRLRKSNKISDLDLPSSTIWFARAAIEVRTGVRYDIEHVQIAAWLEGMIPPESVSRIPEWYVNKFMNGVTPNFRELKRIVTDLYNARQKALAAAVPEPDTLSK
jgi:hypothetical protein